MYELSPVTDRIMRIRQRYRTTKPKIDINRYRLVTDFYQQHPQITGILKRAKNLRNLFENMPTPVFEDELIAGFQGTTYRCCALYPEQSFRWFMEELRAGVIPTRGMDPYDLDEEDAKYLDETGDYWVNNCVSALYDEYIPRTYRDKIGNNWALSFHATDNVQSPVGHFAANFWKAVDRGFWSIKEEAETKMARIEEDGINDFDAYKYNFYRAVSIVSEGICIWADRYGDECDRQAAECQDPVRKAELEEMADTFHWIFKNPCRNFHDAVQAVYLYQLAMCLDGQQHGISFGRVDQYIGKYAEKDIAEGKKTRAQCQEIMDSFYLKVAECNKIWSERATASNPGYTSGQLMTLGGVDKKGNDATNVATYMMLESASRLLLHTPPQALRIHDGTPDDLWELALLASKRAGGVPSYEYDGVIIPAMLRRGVSLEDARNYCLIGCVELQVCGGEWAQPGGTGTESYYNIVVAMLQGLNNGINTYAFPPGSPPPTQTGPATGYLYEMESMDEVLEAVRKAIMFWGKWQCGLINMWETVAAYHTPLPMASATFDGCMESGKDVMWGGAKYNSCGNSCIGLGNVADSLNIIDQLCFKEKYCTTRELYDALVSNWEGHEELRQYIVGKAGHYGNAND
ncbi:MAG: pyruvate formate lyase family protein, partial [Lachnospiraceae bacterium]|nr:pyruvate formate lyase family protein [Lachnospiraceae bacterium]